MSKKSKKEDIYSRLYKSGVHKRKGLVEELIEEFLQKSNVIVPIDSYLNQKDVYGVIVIEARGSDRYVRGYLFSPDVPRDKARMLTYLMPDVESENLKKYSEAVREFLSRLD
jgi:hypothetical protein